MADDRARKKPAPFAPEPRRNHREGPLLHDNTRALQQLRVTLEALDYSATGVRKALNSQDDLSLHLANLPVYLRRLPKGSPLSSVIKLFLLGVPVDEGDMARALAPLQLEELVTIGLLERTPKGIISPFQLLPYDGLLIVSDRHEANFPDLPFDYVTSVNPTSMTLANLTVRQPVRSALDLGTGCGVEALLAARHSDSVTAVDINPRALNFTAFNAQLNGIPHLECRLGSLFEPVENRRFDLIVCNPPYVVSPDSSYEFRDSGLAGDTICRQIIRQVPVFLEEGGLAHVLCNWGLSANEEWSAPLRQWVEGDGCDCLLLHYRTEDPLTYAGKWNQPLQSANPTAYEQTIDRWLEYYQRLGIEAIASGAVILRRSSGTKPKWIRAEEIPPGPIHPSSQHILRIFETQDYLSGIEEERTLLSDTFRLVKSHRLEQMLTYRDGTYTVQGSLLRLEEGLEFRGNVDAYVLHLLSRCDGNRRLVDILNELCQAAGLNVEELSSATVPVVRRLLELGFLVPV